MTWVDEKGQEFQISKDWDNTYMVILKLAYTDVRVGDGFNCFKGAKKALEERATGKLVEKYSYF